MIKNQAGLSEVTGFGVKINKLRSEEVIGGDAKEYEAGMEQLALANQVVVGAMLDKVAISTKIESMG